MYMDGMKPEVLLFLVTYFSDSFWRQISPEQQRELEVGVPREKKELGKREKIRRRRRRRRRKRGRRRKEMKILAFLSRADGFIAK